MSVHYNFRLDFINNPYNYGTKHYYGSNKPSKTDMVWCGKNKINENENNMKKEIRLVLTMTMLIALCVGVVACCAMAIGSAVREDDSNAVGYSFMAAVFAVFATKLVDIIESKETTSNSSLKKMSDEADEQIAKLKELENMSKNGKSSLTPTAKEAAKQFESKAFVKVLRLDKFEPQFETRITDLCYEAWVAGYFYAKREKEQ